MRLSGATNAITEFEGYKPVSDEAIIAAIARNADHVALVPSCQAEVAEQLKQRGAAAAGPIGALFEHSWHRREFGSHLTNVIRALALESLGYQVTVTELTGWEHSLKNELILARRVHRENRGAREKLESLLQSTGVAPKVARELGLGSGQALRRSSGRT